MARLLKSGRTFDAQILSTYPLASNASADFAFAVLRSALATTLQPPRAAANMKTSICRRVWAIDPIRREGLVRTSAASRTAPRLTVGGKSLLPLLGQSEIVQLARIVLGDQDTIDRLLLRLAGRALRKIGVGLLDGELSDLEGRLQNSRRDLTGLDLVTHVVRSVEADHNHVVAVRRLQRRGGAHRHGVVPGDHALDLGVSLQHRLHLRIGLGLAPVGALLGHRLQVRKLVDHIVVALGTNASVGIRLLADELRVWSFLTHFLGELLAAE